MLWLYNVNICEKYRFVGKEFYQNNSLLTLLSSVEIHQNSPFKHENYITFILSLFTITINKKVSYYIFTKLPCFNKLKGDWSHADYL